MLEVLLQKINIFLVNNLKKKLSVYIKKRYSKNDLKVFLKKKKDFKIVKIN